MAALLNRCRKQICCYINTRCHCRDDAFDSPMTTIRNTIQKMTSASSATTASCVKSSGSHLVGMLVPTASNFYYLAEYHLSLHPLLKELHKEVEDCGICYMLTAFHLLSQCTLGLFLGYPGCRTASRWYIRLEDLLQLHLYTFD
jgi:hypothetical protein